METIELSTKKLLGELGIENPSGALVEQIRDHFDKVMIEVFMRRAPEEILPELRRRIETQDAGLEIFIAEAALRIPGLAEELEEAVVREYEVLKSMFQNNPNQQAH